MTRSADASSRTPPGTGAARATRCSASTRRRGEPHRPSARTLATAIEAGQAHEEVYLAWRCAHDLRVAHRTKDTARGQERAEKILEPFHTCPIPEVARLGRTLRRWRQVFLAHFTTDRANNDATEAVNGITKLHRCLARGYRNLENHRLRKLLAAGGLTP